MQQHVKILAVLHIILGGLGVMAALVVMLVFGGLAALSQRAMDFDIPGAAISVIGAIAFLVLIAISVPGLIAGIGLLTFQPWARILTIIISAIELPGFPFHTALGIYGLWVLLSNEGTALFERRWSSAVPR